jgi:hypothetical protein
MSELCKHDTFKDICGTCHRDAQITRLTEEVERLRAALDEAQQAFALESYNAVRLRAALEAALEDGVGYVSYSCDEDECGNCVCCGEVSYKPHAPYCWTLKARAALEET